MNRIHHWYCNRDAWKRRVREDLMPPALDGVELGDAVLEVGPGFGPATEVLSARPGRLTALEIDPGLAGALRERFAGRAEIVDGDATSMPFGDESFSAAVCFTMLHHVPSSAEQDRVFAEVRRVLRPGAAFAGTDSRGRRLGWKLLHVGDLKLVIEPDDLERRLVAAGFEDVQVDTDRDSYRFRAYRPAHTA
jgi:ubiquinone/menaquinone biosynthesis C-methylase UbiE